MPDRKWDRFWLGAIASLVFAVAVLAVLTPDRNRQRRFEGYTRGAFEAGKYRQITGHNPSYAWILAAASYTRPAGQNDEDWIRITDAKAQAWEAEHIGSASDR